MFRFLVSAMYTAGKVLFFLALLLAAPLHARPLAAQTAPAFVQAGAAALPEAGAQIGYVSPGRFYTVEGALYLSGAPAFAGGSGDVQGAIGVGVALRVLGIVRLFTEAGSAYDLDAGLRFGPGLAFQANETRADANRRFRLFVDPFVRGLRRLSPGVALFAELGAARPALRAGLWVRF